MVLNEIVFTKDNNEFILRRETGHKDKHKMHFLLYSFTECVNTVCHTCVLLKYLTLISHKMGKFMTLLMMPDFRSHFRVRLILEVILE